jgi:hypothetical protein
MRVQPGGTKEPQRASWRIAGLTAHPEIVSVIAATLKRITTNWTPIAEDRSVHSCHPLAPILRMVT